MISLPAPFLTRTLFHPSPCGPRCFRPGEPGVLVLLNYTIKISYGKTDSPSPIDMSGFRFCYFTYQRRHENRYIWCMLICLSSVKFYWTHALQWLENVPHWVHYLHFLIQGIILMTGKVLEEMI